MFSKWNRSATPVKSSSFVIKFIYLLSLFDTWKGCKYLSLSGVVLHIFLISALTSAGEDVITVDPSEYSNGFGDHTNDIENNSQASNSKNSFKITVTGRIYLQNFRPKIWKRSYVVQLQGHKGIIYKLLKKIGKIGILSRGPSWDKIGTHPALRIRIRTVPHLKSPPGSGSGFRR